jgi:DNA modification methylase
MIKEVIGNCELYCGDCLEIFNQLDGYDLSITDPPYKMEIHGRGFAAKRDYYSKLDYGTNKDFVLSDLFYDLLISKISETNMTFFCNKLMKLDIENWAVSKGYTFDELVLCKKSPPPLTNNQWLPDKEFAVHIFKSLSVRGDYQTKRTWFVDNNYQDKSIDHPSVKPLYIIEHIINNVSDVGQTIIDPFMGSGTTGVGCVRLGRKFIGIEINKDFFDISCKRIDAENRQTDLFRTEKMSQQELL